MDPMGYIFHISDGDSAYLSIFPLVATACAVMAPTAMSPGERNGAPVVSTVVYASCVGFQPSKVIQDFFHPVQDGAPQVRSWCLKPITIHYL